METYITFEFTEKEVARLISSLSMIKTPNPTECLKHELCAQCLKKCKPHDAVLKWFNKHRKKV